MAKHLGSIDKLYYGTAGTTVGTGTELKAVKDVKISYSREDVDVSDRNSGEWGSTIAGKKSCQLTFTYYDTNSGNGDALDTALEALLSAWHSGTLIAFKAVSASGRGIDADFSIASVDDDQTNESAGTYAFTCNVNTDKRQPTALSAVQGSSSQG